MNGAFFALISRMRNIRRWGLMRNTYEENVQEHSHMTAVLAHALAVIRRDVFGGESDPDRCAAAALFHDASEILTGDLPTPVKYANRDIKVSYKEVERLAVEKLTAMLPEKLRGEYENLILCEDPGVLEIIKAADKLSAYIKCVEELRAGNHEFESASGQIRTTLDNYAMPEVQYFMERFMPAFGMTLDELTMKEE
ncbi:MAG: 5'-deoxynucleotidase [Clostridiales bacterium]|nr:5'-deoxynucleotidase [Clostridiales bacterium]